jgi:hypothetical protein
MNKQEIRGVNGLLPDGGMPLPPKVMQIMESRKVWAGVIGMATTLTLWWLGEIDGARAVEAMTWVLGIFIGSVALEDGMTRLFSSLAHSVASPVSANEVGGVAKQSGERENANKG